MARQPYMHVDRDEMDALIKMCHLYNYDPATKKAVRVLTWEQHVQMLQDKVDSKHNIAKTSIGDVLISTVFMPFDTFSKHTTWFETMVLGGPHNGRQERHAAYEDVIACHDELVRMHTEGSKESLENITYEDNVDDTEGNEEA